MMQRPTQQSSIDGDIDAAFTRHGCSLTWDLPHIVVGEDEHRLENLKN